MGPSASSTAASAPSAALDKQQLIYSYWNDTNRPPYKVVETRTRGKGKVIIVDEAPGRGGEGRVGGRSLQIAAVSELDAQHGELPSDPVARVDRRLMYDWVKYFTMGESAQSVYGALGTMWASEPVLMRAMDASSSKKMGKDGGAPPGASTSSNSVFVSALMDFDEIASWVDGGLAAVYKNNPNSIVTMVSDSNLHRFMEFDLGKNDPKGPYHVREFETRMIGMGSVREFVQCSRSWEKQKVFLTLKVEEEEGGVVGGLVERMVDWEALGSVLASQRFSVVKREVRVEMGTKNGVLPARYATQDQLLVQAFGHLYPYPTHHPYDKMAMASLETLNPEDWPGTKDVRLHRAILAPGDVLYVPAYWFVHVQELDKETVCTRVPLSNGARAPTTTGAAAATLSRRPPARNATLLRVSRILEDRVAQTVGIPHIKRWLRIISKNTETKFLDLSTVKGYKCARMTQDIRDDLACSNLSVESSLSLIIDRRLEPTPWLNQNFREPLLLTDTPKIYQDTRTEEERKYPTLFRKKLERDGWTVEQTKSTVPIPGVNMPKDADYRLI